ncbi:MAG: DUF3426 domain-containing protein [Gammaproteobacteria bacterium]|nr:DUF3426 domain-containing protein [Gammaproteobacteria bacterium]
MFSALARLADEPTSLPAITTAIAAETRPASPRLIIDNAADFAEVSITEAPRDDTAPLSVINIDAVPAVLRADVERLVRRQRSGLVWAWSVLALFGATALLAQLAWNYRAPLLARYPNLRPASAQLCTELGCRLDPPHDARAIELVARDVREHPHYAQALLVNATLANRSAAAAAYPIIELGIYDNTGSVVGIRRFEPNQYLDKSIDPTTGLAAGRRLYVVLEIAEASARAASFEFTFL